MTHTTYLCFHFIFLSFDSFLKMNAILQETIRRYCNDFDSDSDNGDKYQKSDDEIANIILPSDGHDKRLVLMSVIIPYSHTYLAVANSLLDLVVFGKAESEFVQICVREITRRYESFECKYGMLVNIYHQQTLRLKLVLILIVIFFILKFYVNR